MRRTIGLVVTVMVLYLAVGGCSDDEVSSGGEDVGPDAATEEDGGISHDAQDAQLEVGADPQDASSDVNSEDAEVTDIDLSGQWVKLTAASALTDTVVGDEEESTTYSLLRVEIDHQADELSLVSEACAVDIVDESDFANTIIPDSFVDALEPTQREGTFSSGVFELPRHYEVRGVEFDDGENPESEPLPEDADDPRIFDADGDGNPGLTIFVDAGIVSGEIYVVQRGWDELEGEVIDEDRIEGLLEWNDEQEILGASEEALLIAEPTSRPNPEPESSYFSMRRLDETESDDCASLIARSESDFSVSFPQ